MQIIEFVIANDNRKDSSFSLFPTCALLDYSLHNLLRLDSIYCAKNNYDDDDDNNNDNA